MKPIARGDDPRGGQPWHPYSLARDALASRFGWTCSFCEAPLKIGAHVEHKLPKDTYVHLAHDWENFLLACVHCNSRKSTKVLPVLWPDVDNTFRAFSYARASRVEVSDQLSDTVKPLAANLIDLVGLDNVPAPGSSDRDLRFLWRDQAWSKADIARQHLATQSENEVLREAIQLLAIETGFFSVWMAAFHDDADMRQRFITGFQAAADCFDAATNPLPRPGGHC